MHPIIHKTFGGLTFQYYFRQFFFGCILAMLWVSFDEGKSIGLWALALINTFLYPYSRFVYESIVDFILGNNFFIVSGILDFVGESNQNVIEPCYITQKRKFLYSLYWRARLTGLYNIEPDCTIRRNNKRSQKVPELIGRLGSN